MSILKTLSSVQPKILAVLYTSKFNTYYKKEKDNQIVDVYWADNDSVNALKELAKDGLTINMSKYGGFEQVGSIGSTLPSADTRITTIPGDIVLYSSNQIVIFYDSNTWPYTKLGHINLSKSELVDLLGDEDVVITLTLK